MRALLLAAGLVGAMALAAGCGDKERPGVADPSSGHAGKAGMVMSKGGSSGTSNTGDGGDGGSGEDAVDPLGPTVTITSPEQVDDPNDGEVLIGAEVSVTCVVKQSEVDGSSKVDGTSVKLARLEDGKVVDEKKGMVGTEVDEYTATFSLTNAPAGPIAFSCSAASLDKKVDADEVSTFLDKGPLVTILTPVKDAALPLTSVLEVSFNVEPSKLTDDDPGAAVAAVELEIGGVSMDLGHAEESPGRYRLDVDLTDGTLFKPAPNGPTPIVVKATNKREPAPVTAEASQLAIIDGNAPVLAITSPVNKAVIGGKVALKFTATDTVSGIDPATVYVSLNDEDSYFDANSDAWSFKDGVFTYEFDSRQVKNSLVQVTVRVGGKDKVGNAAAPVSWTLYLDNYPPAIDLDPANIRTYGTDGQCSHAFDPVGSEALSDLGKVLVAGTLRAVIWDYTNSAPGIPVVHLACANQASARLYVRRADDAALLVDTNGDGACDDVSDVDSKDAVVLSPVSKLGLPWMNTTDALEAPAIASLADCKKTTQGTPDEPKHVCTNEVSDMYQVIQHTLVKDNGEKEPVIYAQAPTPNSLECTGIGWEFTSIFNHDYDGWLCFAARAVDNAGNVGVSRPLRVCVDDPNVPGSPECWSSSVEPPSCADACTTPAQWDPGTVFWN